MPNPTCGETYTLSTSVDAGYLDLVVTPSGRASSGSWNFNGNGSWADSSKWSPTTVPSSGTVTFGGVPNQPTNPITVTLDGNQSAGGLVFNVSGSGYTLSQGTRRGVDHRHGGPGSITVLSGTHTISAPIVLAGSLAVNTTGGGALDLSGSVSEATPGSGAIVLNGGELILSGTGSYTGGTTVNNGGVLCLTSPTGIANGTNLTVAAGGTFIYDPSVQAAPAAGHGGGITTASTVARCPNREPWRCWQRGWSWVWVLPGGEGKGFEPSGPFHK